VGGGALALLAAWARDEAPPLIEAPKDETVARAAPEVAATVRAPVAADPAPKEGPPVMRDEAILGAKTASMARSMEAVRRVRAS
jgi:hypothetical protein